MQCLEVATHLGDPMVVVGNPGRIFGSQEVPMNFWSSAWQQASKQTAAKGPDRYEQTRLQAQEELWMEWMMMMMQRHAWAHQHAGVRDEPGASGGGSCTMVCIDFMMGGLGHGTQTRASTPAGSAGAWS
eukprot:gene10385-biopygen7446